MVQISILQELKKDWGIRLFIGKNEDFSSRV